jgi:hypothetical protein
MTVDAFCRNDHVIVSPTRGAFAVPTDEAQRRLGRRREVRYAVPTFPVRAELSRTDDLWHPRSSEDPAHRWLRARLAEVGHAQRR